MTVLVIGGANVDVKLQTRAPAVPATSNPGTRTQGAGGVARNVAEGLSRYGVPTRLLTAVGDDALGAELLRETAAAGVDVDAVQRVPGVPTGTYTAVLDHAGDLLIAVAAMDVLDALTPEAIPDGVFDGAAWVVADGNLRAETLAHVLECAASRAVPVAFEPVSVPKAARLRAVLRAGPPTLVTPNVAELGALLGQDVADEVDAIGDAAAELHAWGTELVSVRRGASGSVLSVGGHIHPIPALPAPVRDVTGAGDAMLAAFLAARLGGENVLAAAQLGHAAAALTVESARTVVPGLTLEGLRARLEMGRTGG